MILPRSCQDFSRILLEYKIWQDRCNKILEQESCKIGKIIARAKIWQDFGTNLVTSCHFLPLLARILQDFFDGVCIPLILQVGLSTLNLFHAIIIPFSFQTQNSSFKLFDLIDCFVCLHCFLNYDGYM